MFIKSSKLIDYLLAENKRLGEEIVSLYKDKVEESEKEHAGRVELALMCNRINTLNNDEIKEAVTKYLIVGWNKK